MKVFRHFLLLMCDYLVFTNAFLEQSRCEDYYKGFYLADDYNRNSPPIPENDAGKNNEFVLKTKSALWDVDEVKLK